MKRIIGPCTLILGDCLDVLPTLSGIDAVVMDPPYGVRLNKDRTKHREKDVAYNSTDDSEENVLENIVLPALVLCRKATPRVVVMSGHRLMQRYPKADDIGCFFCPTGSGSGPWGFNCFNPILYYGLCPYQESGQGRMPSSVSATHWFRREVNHPCPKPLKMMEWLVKRASLAGHTVCDPFMGSGTTGMACVRHGRKFIGIEKDPEYFEVACAEIEAEVHRTKHTLLGVIDTPLQPTTKGFGLAVGRLGKSNGKVKAK